MGRPAWEYNLVGVPRAPRALVDELLTAVDESEIAAYCAVRRSGPMPDDVLWALLESMSRSIGRRSRHRAA